MGGVYQKAHLSDAVQHQQEDAAKHSDASSIDGNTNIAAETTDRASGARTPQEPENVNSRRHYAENMHHEPDALPEPSAAANAAAAALEPAPKGTSRRRKESGHAKGHSNRSEAQRPGKTDRPFAFFSRTAAGPDLPSSKDSLMNAIKERDQLILELDEDLNKSDKATRRLRREVSDLAHQNEELQRQLELQDSQIRSVQDHQLKSVEAKGFLRAEDDSSVRQKLRTMATRWKSWAKEHSVRSLEHVRDADHPAAVKIYRSHTVPEELLSPKNATVAPGIILHAVLARFITNFILRKPFFCLPNGLNINGGQSGSQPNVSEAFDSEYRRVQVQGDRSLAHKWRSLTLLMVDPPEHESKAQLQNFQESQRTKDAYYHRATNTFDEYARVIMRNQDPTIRRKELFEIMQAAGEVFSFLWKQKVYIESRLEEYQGQPFTAASSQLEAHPALHLEDGDTKLDGSPIEMVVQPAILAFGNEDGTAYHQSKVWAKAVVWLGARPSQ